ncbi:MAG: hypothetical protein V5A68_03870 [Candidatus Thermoplasmatota archaeon]
MKNAVIGVVHPFSINYFDEYLSSLNKQSYENFKLFIFGDRIKYQDIKNLFDKHNKIDVEFNELNNNLSISKGRQVALSYVKEKQFENCIFTDTDDLYHKDYVKFMVSSLSEENNNIVFSDISLLFPGKKKVNNYFKKCGVPNKVNLDFLFEKNCIGLGHSGIKINLYDEDIVFPDDIVVVDWWLFSVLMERNNCTASFIDKSLIYYRQYEENTAGFLNLDEKKILQGLKVKMVHYKSLIKFNDKYEKYYDIFNQFIVKINDDEEFRKKYVKHIRSQFKDKLYLWWEFAKPVTNIKD